MAKDPSAVTTPEGAVVKIVNSTMLDDAMSYTANRIRNKTGDTNQIIWDSAKGFGDAIDGIPGCVPPSGTINITENGTKNIAGYAEALVAVRNGTNNMHIEYENPSDISGTGSYITVVTGSDILKQVRSLDTLIVISHFSGEGARVHCALGCNSTYYAPIVVETASTPSKQAAVRVTAAGGYNERSNPYSLIDDTNLSTGSGRAYITPDGDLRLYGNTSSYPIKAGRVIVDVLWETV